MGNRRVLTRALTKLTILGFFSVAQLPWTGFFHTFFTLLIFSAVLDALTAVYLRQSMNARTFTYWDEAALFCLCAECVSFAS
jgi:hypothetical protein